MHLVSDYIQSAGKGACYVCRAHRRSKTELVLDFERDIDFEGALQVCAPCIKEAAKLTGAVAEATAKLRREKDDLAQRYVEAQVRADAAEAALDALRRYETVKDEA